MKNTFLKKVFLILMSIILFTTCEKNNKENDSIVAENKSNIKIQDSQSTRNNTSDFSIYKKPKLFDVNIAKRSVYAHINDREEWSTLTIYNKRKICRIQVLSMGRIEKPIGNFQLGGTTTFKEDIYNIELYKNDLTIVLKNKKFYFLNYANSISVYSFDFAKASHENIEYLRKVRLSIGDEVNK